MTREEERIKQIEKFAYERYECYEDYSAFIAGAIWSDKHPKNVWHDASEEPRYEEFLLAEETDEFNIYKLCRQEDNNSWEFLVSAMGIIRWAYISDLLPKQFGNPKSDK